MAHPHPMRTWRKENGKTLADIATLVRVSPSHLSEIENGNNESSLALAVRLSNVTGIPIEKLATWRAESSEQEVAV